VTPLLLVLAGTALIIWNKTGADDFARYWKLSPTDISARSLRATHIVIGVLLIALGALKWLRLA
jgi:hypothetical protein